MKCVNIILIAAMFFITGCSPFRYDATYNGRIINADTAEPIEGAAVLGVWYKEYLGPAGEISAFHDAREKKQRGVKTKRCQSYTIHTMKSATYIKVADLPR
jgi:hypothetical protein